MKTGFFLTCVKKDQETRSVSRKLIHKESAPSRITSDIS